MQISTIICCSKERNVSSIRHGRAGGARATNKNKTVSDYTTEYIRKRNIGFLQKPVFLSSVNRKSNANFHHYLLQ